MKIENILKIIGPILFVYVLSKIDFGELLFALKNVNYIYLFISLIFWISLLVIRHLKWKVMIDFFDPKVSFLKSFQIFLKGVFLGMVTPGKLGEFYRAKYLQENSNLSFKKSFLTVFVDRIIDILGTALISIVAIFFLVYSMGLKIPFIIFIFLILVLILSISIFVIKDQTKSILKFILKIPFLSFLKEKSENFIEDFFNDLKEIKFLLYLKSFAYDLVSYLATAFALFFLALSLGITVPFWYFYLVDPFVSLVVVLPISILGIGIREITYIFLLSPFGIELNQAVTFSLLVMFFNIIIGVPGLILYFTKQSGGKERLGIYSKFPFYNQKIRIKDLTCVFINRPKEKLLKFLQNYFKNENILLLKSGRQGIEIILKSLDLKEGDEIIIPSFICPVVVEAVQRAGGKPIFSEIEKQGFNLEIEEVKKIISSRTRAIILPHLFGIPAKLEEFVKLAEEHNLVLIEDCAHALGAEYQGKLVGTFSDFAIFSFGFSKNVGGIGGGFIISKNRDNLGKIKNSFSFDKEKLSLKHCLELFLIPFVFNKYLYFLFSLLVEGYGKLRRKAEGEKEFTLFLSDLEAKVALQKLRCYEKEKQRRNSASLIYKKELGNIFSFPEVVTGSDPAYLSFPVFASNEIFVILEKNNLPVQRVEFGKPGEKLPDNYFLLSLDYSPKDIERICRLIKKKLNI